MSRVRSKKRKSAGMASCRAPHPMQEKRLFNMMKNKRKVLLVSVIVLTTSLGHETCERNVYQSLQNITYSCHFLTLFSYSSYSTASTPSAPNEENSCTEIHVTFEMGRQMRDCFITTFLQVFFHILS